MCGICGIYYPELSKTPERATIEAMTARLRHRGPDGSGVHIDGPVGLGATRLAIIDLSHRADQPMVLAGGNYVISFNGEIYNHVELRQELEQQGVRFETSSDTEVLLRLYMLRGVACLDVLRGMFAFAIWDRKLGQLFLARDRAGEKPLVYAQWNGMFAFASEIKALLAIPGLPREIDPVGLHYGLHYVNVPAPYSAFRHIRKLRSAEYMIVSQSGVRRERYWSPRIDAASRITSSREAAHEVRRCLEDTVKIICRSDVPIGAMLSGGLDSSGVVSLMGSSGRSFDTFCVSYDHPSRDAEFTAARLVADRYRTRHHELIFREDQLAAAAEAVRSFDEPFATFVPLHATALSRLIGSRVKVAITGNGGDELFGGYADHRTLLRLEQRLPLWNRIGGWGAGRIIERLPLRMLRRSWDKYRAMGAVPRNRLAAELRMAAAAAFCGETYSTAMKAATREVDAFDLFVAAYDEYGGDSLLEGFLVQQLLVGSQHSIVDIPDITGMASSLEYRSPFLDRQMIELAARIPARFKVDPGLGDAGGKMVLREALKDLLPPEVLSMKKAGFGSPIPYRSWMTGEWSGYVRERLASEKLSGAGLFDSRSLLSLHDHARLGHPAPLDLLWGVVMISQWLEEYF